jgi:hypothetical protein
MLRWDVMGAGWRRGRWLGALAGVGLGAGVACSQGASSTSHNPGDDFYPSEASPVTPPQGGPDADYDDGAFNGTDGAYGATYGTGGGYSTITICPPPDASAGADASLGSSGDGGAAGDAAWYPSSDASSDASGAGGAYGSSGGAASCTPIPAACAATPNCTCFLTALQSSLACTYPHCEDTMGAGFPIYCP